MHSRAVAVADDLQSETASAGIGKIASISGSAPRKGTLISTLCVRIPAAVWVRGLVLFCALLLLKLALVIELGEHLYQTHFRFDWPSVSRLNFVAFHGLIVIGVLSLLRLAQSCRAAGLRTVRAINATAVVLGLSFIFFTFHTGPKNYLYPILSGILRWTSLGPYLSLDCCFRQPYLGAWLFGYALAYYILARTGREGWTLYLTTLCAGAFAWLNLRELVVYRDQLLLADSLGLAGLGLTLRRGSVRQNLALTRGGRSGFAWLLLPMGWTCFFAVEMLHFALPLPGLPLAYFGMFVGFAVAIFGLASLWARRGGFWNAWICLVPFYFSAWLLLGNTHYPLAENFDKVLFLSFTLPRYFLGEFCLAAGLIAVAALWCRWSPKAALWWLDCASVLLIVLSFVDLRFCHVMGTRLDWHLLALGHSPKMVWRITKPYLGGDLMAVVMIVLAYIAVVRSAQWWAQKGELQEKGVSVSPGMRLVAVCFCVLGILGILVSDSDKAEGQVVLRLVETSSVWKRATGEALSRDKFLKTASSLGLGNFEPAVQVAVGEQPRDLNVVVFFLESSYNKYLSLFGSAEQTEPLLSRYKDRMELFPNFFSDFAGSIQARFASFTSVYPVRDYHAFTTERVEVKGIFTIFHELGYTCSMFDSSFFDYTGFGDFLRDRGLDEMYDANNMPGTRSTEPVSWGLREGETLKAMRAEIQKYAASNRHFFLTYVPAAPHYPYDGLPPQFAKHPLGVMNDLTPPYLNELLYMDWVISSVLDQLRDSGLLDKTMVIITNDHGEMLGANGGPIGHGWVITPELVNTPLIIMDPAKRGFHVNYTVGSQVDLLPTILHRMRIPAPAGQLYEGRSLDAPPLPGRVEYLNSYQQYAFLTGDQLIVGDREADKSGNPRQQAYIISNQGTRTVFTETPVSNLPPVSIGRFDEFQENLLHNYSVYLANIHPKNH